MLLRNYVWQLAVHKPGWGKSSRPRESHGSSSLSPALLQPLPCSLFSSSLSPAPPASPLLSALLQPLPCSPSVSPCSPLLSSNLSPALLQSPPCCWLSLEPVSTSQGWVLAQASQWLPWLLDHCQSLLARAAGTPIREPVLHTLWQSLAFYLY